VGRSVYRIASRNAAILRDSRRWNASLCGDCLKAAEIASERVDRSVEDGATSVVKWQPVKARHHHGRAPMVKLPVRTWILNAAAVFSGQHGAVTRQAEQSGCSRQAVYQHARKLEERLAAEPAADPPTEDRPPPKAVTAPGPASGSHILLDKDKLKELTTTAFAMGVSLRQIEDLLGVLLPADAVPDHSTLGRWIQVEGARAGAVLAELDRACADRVQTLALDEIFFGGDRPSSGSSRRA
jgi:hypothetical protein